MEDTTEKWAPYSNYTWFKGFHKYSIFDFPQEDLDSYKKGFASIGYDDFSHGSLEKGFEKIALYVSGKHVKHIARQLENGHWTSKLGDYQDIEHYTLNVLESDEYGYAKIFMKRKKPNKIWKKIEQIKKII